MLSETSVARFNKKNKSNNYSQLRLLSKCRKMEIFKLIHPNNNKNQSYQNKININNLILWIKTKLLGIKNINLANRLIRLNN
jgi:hypothetical protein